MTTRTLATLLTAKNPVQRSSIDDEEELLIQIVQNLFKRYQFSSILLSLFYGIELINYSETQSNNWKTKGAEITLLNSLSAILIT